MVLQALETFSTETLGLTKLPPHLPTFLLSFAFFLLVHQVLGPVLSIWLFSETYGKMNRRGKNNWLMHIVSQVHALIIIPLALNSLHLETLDRDRAFGWDEQSGFIQAISCGYFLWDTLDAVVNYIDLGFVIHGLACLLIYMLSYRPFVAYYACRCLLWEISTVFLNNQWFMDKTGRTGSKLQLFNGLLLVGSFLGVRLVYGGITSWDFHKTLYSARKDIPMTYRIIYGGGNVVLQGLNWIWFKKIINAIRRRFETPNTKSD